MEGLNLINTFAEFKDEKNIDRATMMKILEEVFRSQLIKMFGSADKFDIIINIDKGDFEIWRNREVVDVVEDPNTQISLEEVSKVDDSYEVGEEYTEAFSLEKFGRRGILNLRQNLAGRIMDLEKANLYNDYKERIGEIIVVEVYQVWKREILVRDENGNDLSLPKDEQIPNEYLKKGDTIKAIIQNVEMINNAPVITLSRRSNKFLEKLFEQEVPEVFDGLITIKKVVRIPGDRAKVAVESYDDRIDPVGACVGVKGSRIHGIVRELNNENIDIIPWTTNLQLLIQRALSSVKVSEIKINDNEKRVAVYLKPTDVQFAVGKGGKNIELVEQLIEMNIEIYRDITEDEDDVLLSEFSDEIDKWVISELQRIGCDTAKSVLALPVWDIVKRADLEEETVIEVMNILKSEFPDEDSVRKDV